jgi:hypothetical protein
VVRLSLGEMERQANDSGKAEAENGLRTKFVWLKRFGRYPVAQIPIDRFCDSLAQPVLRFKTAFE